MINPKKQTQSLPWTPARYRRTETVWPMWSLTFHPGTSVFFWPCRWASYSLFHGLNLAPGLWPMLWAGLACTVCSGRNTALIPVIYSFSCAALHDGVRRTHHHPSASGRGSLSATWQPGPEPTHQHHILRQWPVHRAAGHLWRQVRMLEPLNFFSHGWYFCEAQLKHRALKIWAFDFRLIIM